MPNDILKLEPQTIYNFYYTWKYFLDNIEKTNQYAKIYGITYNISKAYLASFKKVVSKQIQKYISRGRIDKDFDTSFDFETANHEELDVLMNKTFRSDMRRRNTVWNEVTSHLRKLEDCYRDQKELSTIFQEIDRTNNCIHNTHELVLTKFTNGFALLEAFDFAHEATLESLESKVSPEISNVLISDKEQENMALKFGNAKYYTPMEESISKFNQMVEDLLLEALIPFNPADHNTTVQKRPVSLIIGRFQPFHKGHQSLIDAASNNVIVGIVRGAKTSLDKEKNPFDFALQKEIIMNSGISKIVDVIELPNASLPDIITRTRNAGFEPKEMICGRDRYIGYKSQIDKYAEQLNSSITIKMLDRNEEDESSDSPDFVKTISATKVREAIRNNNFKLASSMMNNLTQELFNKMKAALD